jgi:hypothetical protein
MRASVAASILGLPRVLPQAAADAVDRPGRDHVELAIGSGLRKPLEPRALVAALGAADAMIHVLLDNLPATLLGDPQEFLALVFDCLARSTVSAAQSSPRGSQHDFN